MKITISKLQQLIQEELAEASDGGAPFSEVPKGIAPIPHPAGADRHLAYLMDNLGTLDNVAQVLELVNQDMPEFMERFQHYHDYLMS